MNTHTVCCSLAKGEEEEEEEEGAVREEERVKSPPVALPGMGKQSSLPSSMAPSTHQDAAPASLATDDNLPMQTPEGHGSSSTMISYVKPQRTGGSVKSVKSAKQMEHDREKDRQAQIDEEREAVRRAEENLLKGMAGKERALMDKLAAFSVASESAGGKSDSRDNDEKVVRLEHVRSYT